MAQRRYVPSDKLTSLLEMMMQRHRLSEKMAEALQSVQQ